MNSLLIFLLLFVGIPLFELYFLIEVGSEIGALPTIFFTIFTAVLGGFLVRMQGFTTALRVRDAMERGEVPAVEMMEGVMLLVCGILLLLPGFFTDAFGFVCLIPQARRGLILWVLKRSQIIQPVHGGGQQQDDQPARSGRVIEGEFKRDEK
ncbi:FxsA family protein [Solemya velesiana gill symbiont]|uniref:Exlusion protein FxsA n=1 Tax=Solemya velesiana gill symbiont TaxID=1918948 RepID=A0A1T2KYG2_9GAMM|nr:FxsA family protein [Solemya velesiana gill symbiont]OOZ37800.1 exlusion protein FxsA [Solemya velesiana gill symbiont]